MIRYSERLSQVRASRLDAPAPPTTEAPGVGASPDPTPGLIHAILANTLGIDARELRGDACFADLGLNSLLGVRFLDSVNRALGLRIGIQALFEHSSLDEFTAFFTRTVAASGTPLPRARSSEVEPTAGMDRSLRQTDSKPDPKRSGSKVAQRPTPSTSATDIAIIGMSGRFANAPDIDHLWARLQAGDCLVTEVPTTRWDATRFYDPAPGTVGKTISKWAGFLPDIDKFDAAFFGISPTEAVAIDPQQRLFLEEAWRTFENAGYPTDRLRGREIGVYVGAASAGYEQLIEMTGRASDAYAMTGNQPAMFASRIAYMLDLAGPAMTIDTACSSSLVALDLACQALQRGDIEMALVGGVTLFLDEKPFLAMSRVGILSPQGRCKTFDDAADGIANGEAVAAILLKPLAQALADGDRVDAVICASGTNQDGRSNGITAPNPRAQAALMRQVYARGSIDPATIGLVEAHGTGTPLGDPIEVASLREVYGAGDGTGCALGSVKSNLGHSSHAAGLAGLIKAALCLKHRRIVPTINLTRLNARIDLAGSPFYIARDAAEWPAPRHGMRRAAISAFGLSGTNTHVVLEQPPEALRPTLPDGPRLIVLSARSDGALQQRCVDLAAWLRAQANPPRLADLAWTLRAGRTPFAHRLAFVADSHDGLLQRLDAIADRKNDNAVVRGVATAPSPESFAEVSRWTTITRTAEPGELRSALVALGRAFVAGCTIDLAHMHGGCSRAIALPGYPFERASYWPARKQVAVREHRVADQPHPFLDAPLPGPDRAGYAKTFTPDDPVVRDHVIGGRPILHASVFLEMAAAAAVRASGRAISRLESVAWRQTLEIPPPGRSTELRLSSGPEGWQCALHAADARHAFAECRAVAGTHGATALPRLIDPAGTQARATQSFDRSDLAAPLSSAIKLGPTFRGFDRLWISDEGALAWLSGPIDQDCVLPPQVIDAAIQTAVLLAAQNEGQAMRLRYPTTLDDLEIVGPVPKDGCYLLARRSAPAAPDADIVEVDVADQAGRVCLRLRGLRLLVAKAAPPAPQIEPPQARDLQVVWRSRPALFRDAARTNIAVFATHSADPLAARIAQRNGAPVVPLENAPAVAAVIEALQPDALLYVVVSDQAPPSPDNLAAGMEASVLALLRLMQQVAARDLATAPLEWRIVTDRAYAVTGKEHGLPAALGAAVHGLGKAAAREFPAWRMRLLDINSAEADVTSTATLDFLATDPGTATGEPVAWRASARWEPLLEPLPNDTGKAVRAGAVILIVGGLGRVGRSISEFLCRIAGARLVILGRNSLNPEREAFIGTLRASGGAAIYVQGDVADPAAVAAAVAAAQREYGTINGVIQAALDPVFGPIAAASLNEFRGALRPKLLGLASLHNATAGIDLDFFAIFSSIGAFHGFPGNVGQASYCAGCCFEAAYAAKLAATGQPVTVIHWGLWAHQDYRPDLLAQIIAAGTHVLPVPEAAAALLRLLTSGAPQVVHARLTPAIWHALGDESVPDQVADTGFAAALLSMTAASDASTLVVDPGATARFDAYIAGRLAEHIRAQRVPIGPDRSTPDALRARLRVLPKYAALFDALLDILTRHGLVERGNSGLATTPVVALAAPVSLPTEPGAAGAAGLLEPCLDALPAVLAGETPATDVLFPGGSMHRVEPIYRDQPILEFCNDLIAAAVVAIAERAKRPISVLEVGAGTGATTAVVLRACAARGIQVRYRYTDISPGFLQHGKTHHAGPDRDFSILDLERDPEAQGFAAAEADVVIAANVLHATRNVATTLEHVAKLLRPGGLLLASELTRLDDFATLTFGLLDGWWLSEDRAVRLSHGPVLDPTRWEWQLRKSGFDRVCAFSLPGLEDPAAFPHSIIVAARPETAATALARPSAIPSTVRPSTPAGTGSPLAPLVACVRAQVAAALGLAEAAIDPEQPYAEFGVDSIIAPQIADDINRALGIELRSTDLYNYATTSRLAAHIVDKFPEAARKVAALHPAPAADCMPVETTAPSDAGGEANATPPVLPDAPASTPGVQPDRGNCQESIAIIGMSGRFPGAPDVDAYWANLIAGRASIREIDRFDIAPYFAADRGTPGKAYAKWGGLLDDHDCFDPLFFGITPAEADVMDPQQRVLLEAAWHALEDAGHPPHQLSGSRTGVFVGASANNYTAPAAPSLQTLGQSVAILSARIAYLLNLRGPAFPVDTGCSSSLVATHLACQSLLTGESDLALAAGVSINLISPEIYLYLCDAGMASPAGRCKTFDDDADGFVPGEGVGVLVLKRLSDARRDGDRIRAVIRGSGVNQDGKTSGITAPSAESQTALEIDVYRRSGVDPATIGLVEAHGTGTRLGDPIEVAALTDAFAAFTDRKQFCAIGSVKTNIGHAMAAAGIAGLIKLVQAIEHRQLPPSLNFSKANRHIDFADSPFHVVTSPKEWQAQGVRRGAISSFGFSGTNAHLVLEEAPPAPAAAPPAPGPVVVLVSAKTESALQRQLRALVAWLRTPEGSATALFDIAYTLAVRRTHFAHRYAVVTDSHATLITALEAALSGTGTRGRATASTGPRDLEQAASAFRAGEAIDAMLFGGAPRPPAALPLYPFERERYWKFDPIAHTAEPAGSAHPALHPLLDRNLSNRHSFRFAKTLCADDPWLQNHVINGHAILPGAAVIEMMRAALADVADASTGVLTNIVWSAPVALDNGRLELEVLVTPEDEYFLCHVTSSAGAQLHASATARLQTPLTGSSVDPATLLQQCSDRRDPTAIYDAFAASGLSYGPLLRVIERLAVGDREAVAELSLAVGAETKDLVLHPALLDGALQTAAGIGLAGQAVTGAAYIPFALGKLEILDALPARCLAHARLRSSTGNLLKFDIDIFAESGRPVVRIRDLAVRPAPSEASTIQAISALLYRPIWAPKPIAPDNQANAAIVLLGADLAEELPRASGIGRVLRVTAGDHFASRGRDEFTIDPTAPAGYAGLWQEIATERQVIFVLFWPLAHPPLDASGRQTAATTRANLQLETGLEALFHLAKAAIGAGPARPCTTILYLGRTGLQHRPQQNAAAAFARVVMAEHPDIGCRVIEADAPLPLSVFAAEATNRGAAEPHVRYEGPHRLVRELAEADIPARGAPALRAGGVCVISGGAGRLASILAAHLIETRGAKVVLLGRNPPTPALEADLLRLEASGGEVLYLTVDVTDFSALRACLDRARRQFGPLNGVVHAAGALRDGFLYNKTVSDLAAVLAPKVLGAINLDHLTRDDDLDFFALFSSTAAELGVVAQSDYAAANGFLDGLAEMRAGLVQAGTRRGTTMSIGWPLWAQGGMTPTADGQQRLAAAGLLPMPSATGIELFEAGLRLGLSHIVAVHGVPGKLRALIARPMTLDPVAPAVPPVAAIAGIAEAITRYLKGVLAEVTKLRPEQIERGQSFEAYGIDSIMVMRLNVALERDFPDLPKTLFFEYQTITDLTGYFLTHQAARVAKVLASTSPAVDPARPAPPEKPAQDHAPPAAIEGRSSDIAIIGISGLYPAAPDLETFWENLRNGRDCITEIPPQRWSLDGFYDPDRDNTRTSYSKWGGFIDDADTFDARFFNIAPNEAETIDPQARKFLEVAWATLENAGYTRETLFAREADPARRKAGVFVGVMYGDYQLFGPEELAKGNLIGPNAAYWNLANRVSYFMNFHGPSLAVDTACSSSLTAIHLACQSIRDGDCSVALAGGVNLSLHPSKYWILSRAGFAASDGRCRSFGMGGDGYVPGEGIGCILLKPLDRARADQDTIYGVIKGGSVNHGGKTTGYTVPNPNAQATLVDEALTRAGTPPDTIGYIEAHGTGTQLGDPIEIAGLARAFGERPAGSCAIGSVKSNIGHLESAAGIAGLTKVVLQFAHGTLVPSLHAETPNPNLDFARTPFRLQQTLSPWPRQTGTPRRAGISSFGAGGANAHLVIEEPPLAPPRVAADPRTHLIPLSAASSASLQAAAQRLADHLRRHPEHAMVDIAHTLQCGREPMRHRLAVVADTTKALVAALDDFVAGTMRSNCFIGEARRNDAAIPEATNSDNALIRLASTWVLGIGDHQVAAAEPAGQRIALPTYAFARRRCWVKLTPPAASSAAPLHPLIDRIDLDFAGPRFRKSFGPESPYAKDHQVAGKSILPGAVLLEMGRAAVACMPDFLHACMLTELVWERPVTIDQNGVELTVALDRDSDVAQFEILSGADRKTVHARGKIARVDPTEPPVPMDLDALLARCPQRIEAAQIYPMLETAGVVYGPSLRVIDWVAVGTGEAVAALADPTETGTNGAFVFPPALIDAAFQLSFALIPPEAAGRAFLPVGIGRIAAHRKLAAAAMIHARRRQTDANAIALDFAILDAQGRHLATIERFEARPTGTTNPTSAPPANDADHPLPLLTLRPVWVALDASASAETLVDGPIVVLTTAEGLPMARAFEAAAGTKVTTVVLHRHWSPTEEACLRAGAPAPAAIWFLGLFQAMPPDADAQATAAEDVSRALFRLLKALSGWQRPPRLTVVTGRTQQVVPGEPVIPLAAALHGLARAVAHEHPGWPLRVVDIDPHDTSAADLLSIPLPDAASQELAMRGSRLFARRLQRVLLPDREAPVWKQGGVYLIAGGATGIGLALAQRLAETVGARIGLVGRSACDAEKQRALDQINAHGGQVMYLQADLADLAGLRAAVQDLRARFGHIDGVVHSALVMHDATLTRLEEHQFEAVLRPKLRGLVNLAEVVRDDPPDWLLVMSSANAYTANPGQSAYAAASSFADAFALALPQPAVRVLDWGFWGETGRVATADYRANLARAGIYPIATREGLDTIARGLAAPSRQLFVLRIADFILEPLGVLADRAVLIPGRTKGLLPAAIRSANTTVKTRITEHVAEATDFERVNAYGRARLLVEFRSRDILTESRDHQVPSKFAAHLVIQPRYRRLAAALLDMLDRARRTEPAGDPSLRSAALDLERSELLAVAPAAEPYLALLDECLGALMDVLAGRIDANAVLFPEGSTALVEAIYQGNEIVDAYQQTLADGVRAAANRRLADRPPGETVRILEVGAGTGGTTAFAVAALTELGADVEYVFTDIGKGFIEAARERFGRHHDFVRFATLDISAPPEPQGFPPGGFDVVIAANVVHATRDISRTLANLKSLLTRGGLLLLNEAVAAQDFNTLTFGLTTGWWLFEDADRRLPHAPLLDLPGWRRSLGDAGFDGTTVLGADHGALQAIIIAESDGYYTVANAPPVPTTRPVATQATSPPDGNTNRRIEHVLRDAVAAALHLTPDEVEADISFADYGADSIISVDLVGRINTAFSIELKPTALFNYTTIRELAAFIAIEFGKQLGGHEPAAEDGTARRVNEAKRRTGHLREVIRRRMERPAVNREEEFLAREARPATVPGNQLPPDDPAEMSLAAVLLALERGEIDVAEAMKVTAGDD